MLILPYLIITFTTKMKVGILIYNNCSLWAVSGATEILLRANRAQKHYYPNTLKKHFHIDYVSAGKEEIKTHYQFPIQTNTSIFENKTYDIVYIPGTDTNPLAALKENNEAIEWIHKQHELNALIISNCTGSFFIASSGIINNKVATTHWFMAGLFEKSYPDIQLNSNKLIVDNGQTILSGGASSFQNLMIYIIEKFMGHQIALGVSKLYLIDMNKGNQLTYSILNMQKEHNDQSILKAQEYIEANITAKLNLNDISNEVSLSKRTLLRRFKQATGVTPLVYIQKLKVEKAKHILETENKLFEEVVFDIGYEDANAFRKLFVKHTGITPSVYKKRFNMYLVN